MASRGPDLAKQDLAKQAKLFVDTDAGVDDMLALFILMTGFLPSETDVAVTFGNVPVDQAISNLALFSFISGLTPRRLLRGSARPLVGEPQFATNVHGHDGLGGITNLPRWRPPPIQPHPDLFSVTQLAEYDKIIALGPLTNIARLSDASPSSSPLIVMGGAFDVRGNITPFAEFNFHSDPGAANSVFERYAGEIFVVPLDVCNTVTLGRDYLQKLCDSNPGRTLEFLNFIHQPYMDFYRKVEGIDGCHPHDALAVCAASNADLFTWTSGWARVVTEGPERGRSILRPDAAGRHHVARSLVVPRFFEILERAVTSSKESRP